MYSNISKCKKENKVHDHMLIENLIFSTTSPTINTYDKLIWNTLHCINYTCDNVAAAVYSKEYVP